MNRLKDLLDIVTAAEVEGNARDHERMKLVLAGDLSAEEAGFPAVVVAPDVAASSALASAIVATGAEAAPVVLPGYRSVDAWSDEATLAIERARLVAASTTAQQVIPRVLGDVIERTGVLGIPIQVYVTGLKRARDPLAVAKSAVGQVAGSTRSGALRVTCIGDERYHGPSLEEAVKADIGSFGGPDETRQKCAQRVYCARLRNVRDLLLQQLEGIRESQSEIREEANLLRETEKGLSILARAESRTSAGELVGVRDELLRIDSKALCEKAQAAASRRDDRSPVAALVEILEEEVTRAIGRARKAVGPRLEQRHMLLASRVESDYSKARAALGLVVNLPDGASGTEAAFLLEGLSADRDAAFGDLEIACRDLVAPEGVMTRMIEWLRQSMKKVDSESQCNDHSGEDKPSDGKESSRPQNQDRTDTRPDADGPGPEQEEGAGESDDSSESLEDKAKSKLRAMAAHLDPWLERAEAMQLASETERIISEVAARVDAQRDLVSKRWEEQVQDHIATRFQSLHGAVAQAKGTLDLWLLRLSDLEGKLDD